MHISLCCFLNNYISVAMWLLLSFDGFDFAIASCLVNEAKIFFELLYGN